MDVPWKQVSLKIFSSAEKPSPLIVAEIEHVTDGLFGEARRMYMIDNRSAANETRGGHRHPKGGKLEFLVCVRGEMRVRLHHPERCGDVTLWSPDQALVIASDVWHEITLAAGAVLLSVASTNFDPAESLPNKLCDCR